MVITSTSLQTINQVGKMVALGWTDALSITEGEPDFLKRGAEKTVKWGVNQTFYQKNPHSEDIINKMGF